MIILRNKEFALGSKVTKEMMGKLRGCTGGALSTRPVGERAAAAVATFKKQFSPTQPMKSFNRPESGKNIKKVTAHLNFAPIKSSKQRFLDRMKEQAQSNVNYNTTSFVPFKYV